MYVWKACYIKKKRLITLSDFTKQQKDIFVEDTMNVLFQGEFQYTGVLLQSSKHFSLKRYEKLILMDNNTLK